ncbi:MAG: 1-deoxy-D-xylulose-5-phosphate synthase N-terminal domain-containing protein, partial [Clostridia bacterium]|nr:1-deoxy-D-xylulose-5-phosphate synthase N-terminal domain-containing protein [Clostridia bacterium]
VGRWLSDHMESFKNRIKNFLLPHLLFEELGFVYLGPIDGHDLPGLLRVMARARDMRIPVIVHTVTRKGKGYPFSESDPEKFHGVAPFSVETGCVACDAPKGNSEIFGDALVRLARQDARIAAITAAIPSGTGLLRFAKTFPERFFDTGIAEEHALTMAAGMAAEGMLPVVAIYSTFLQRGYDQLLHDICLQKLPVVVAVDRAGLVGADGVTHQGVYDIAFLSTLPNMTIYSPATQQELVHMLELALRGGEPCAIRYNRGALMQAVSETPVEKGRWEELYPIADCTVIATGGMVEVAMRPARELGAGLINARCIKPMDADMLERVRLRARRVITVEDGIDAFGASVALRLPGLETLRLHAPEEPMQHATVSQQRSLAGLTSHDIRRAILGTA